MRMTNTHLNITLRSVEIGHCLVMIVCSFLEQLDRSVFLILHLLQILVCLASSLSARQRIPCNDSDRLTFEAFASDFSVR